MDNDEFPFLQEAYSPKAAHKIDIVFVHGLNPYGSSKHPYETWTHPNGAFWPTDFLAQDLQFARVFIYGYNSNVAQPEYMSVARIKNHADTLLNLLDLERGYAQESSPSKIIFVGHSLGGLVIKHALLNAQENPKYNAIRTATYGLVFFSCPHHGAKGAELGMIAADVARFVSDNKAGNELLELLKTNSLFTRQMSERFRHQLEDYRVVSFVEGMPMRLAGTSSSQIVVDEESAVLGLTGLRETQLMLDADHIGICKIGSKGAMYKMVKGNIKGLVDQALVTMQGYVPPPSTRPTSPQSYPTPPSTNPSAPPLPPRGPSGGAPLYPTNQLPEQEESQQIIGVMFPPAGDDKKSLQLAEYKNKGLWDKAQPLEHQIFQEQQKNLGSENIKALMTAHNLARTYLELGYLNDATNWANWVSSTTQRTLGNKHPLYMKNESFIGEILLEKCLYQEAETCCANVLARQQDSLGDDHLDTLETQRRLGMICKSLGREQDAVTRLQKLPVALERILGENHIHAFYATLDVVEVTLPPLVSDSLGTARFRKEVQQAAKLMPPLYQDIRSGLGPTHPLSIRALRICGIIKSLEGNNTEASDIFRRALSNAEEALGRDSAMTLGIVIMIGMLYVKQNAPGQRGSGTTEARPWLERYLAWVERRMGPNHPEALGTLQMLGMGFMAQQDYLQAEKYYERLTTAYGNSNSKEAREAANMLQLCQMNTRYLKPRNVGGDLTGMLRSLKF